MSGTGSSVKIGVLGGTFNPVHNGHLLIAGAAREKLGLDQVYFIPAARTPLKDGTEILPARHRVAMVRLAISGLPYFKLSELEIDRPGPSYTVDTIAELRQKLGAQTEIHFIIGLDSLAQLPLWKEASRLISLCRLAAVPRPGYSPPDMAALEKAIPGLSRRLTVLDKPLTDISATEIRERVRKGLSIADLVPASVADYIRKNRLYLE